MKVNELQQLIRRMVKEEVASEVSKAMGKVLVEMVKEIKKPTAATPVLTEEVEEEPTVPVLRTNNSRLNSALNETAKNFKPIPRTESGSSLVELMGGGFDKIGKHETVEVGQPTTKLEFLKQMVNESAPPPIQSVLDAGAPVPDSLKKIFKKDFRAIIAKSKERGGGGYFNPGAVLSGESESPS